MWIMNNLGQLKQTFFSLFSFQPFTTMFLPTPEDNLGLTLIHAGTDLVSLRTVRPVRGPFPTAKERIKKWFRAAANDGSWSMQQQWRWRSLGERAETSSVHVWATHLRVCALSMCMNLDLCSCAVQADRLWGRAGSAPTQDAAAKATEVTERWQNASTACSQSVLSVNSGNPCKQWDCRCQARTGAKQ